MRISQAFVATAATALIVATGTAIAGAQSAPPATAALDNPPENPLISARVTSEFLAWQRGRIDRSSYTPVAGGTYDPSLVLVTAPDLQAIGAPQTTTYRTASLLLGDLVYRYDITGTSGAISVLYAINQAGKTDAITFTPLVFRPAAVTP